MIIIELQCTSIGNYKKKHFKIFQIFSLADFKYEHPNKIEETINIDQTKKSIKDDVSNLEDKLNQNLENKLEEGNDINKESNIQNIEDYKECSICLEPIIIGKRLHCGHINHLKCLK